MTTYNTLRQNYRPTKITYLLIAESPPPEDSRTPSSRHFYRSDLIRRDDRLFINTIKAIYPKIADKTEAELQPAKEEWLRRFQADGWYMIEALETSQEHEVTKKDRQARIKESLPSILKRVQELADPDTKIILIKSNVFDVAAKPLQDAGFNVLNTELLDYPGRFNQKAYREKLGRLLAR